MKVIAPTFFDPDPKPPSASRRGVRLGFSGTDRFDKTPPPDGLPGEGTHAPLALFQLMLEDDAVADDFTALIKALLAHDSTVTFMLNSLDRSLEQGPSRDRLLAFTRETLGDPRTAALLENHLRNSLAQPQTIDLLIAGLESLLKKPDTRQSLLNTLKSTIRNPETAALYRQGLETAYGRGLRATLAMKSLEISAASPFAASLLLKALQSALRTNLLRNTLHTSLKNPKIAPLVLEGLNTTLKRQDTTDLMMAGLRQILKDPVSRATLRTLLGGLLQADGLAIRILEEIQSLPVQAGKASA